MTVENISIQIKCLNRGDETKAHTDSQNCIWPGRYSVTGALCFIFMDVNGVFWSLKFILSYRKSIGDYFTPTVTK
jgi:hypothetical protein